MLPDGIRVKQPEREEERREKCEWRFISGGIGRNLLGVDAVQSRGGRGAGGWTGPSWQGCGAPPDRMSSGGEGAPGPVHVKPVTRPAGEARLCGNAPGELRAPDVPPDRSTATGRPRPVRPPCSGRAHGSLPKPGRPQARRPSITQLPCATEDGPQRHAPGHYSLFHRRVWGTGGLCFCSVSE